MVHRSGLNPRLDVPGDTFQCLVVERQQVELQAGLKGLHSFA